MVTRNRIALWTVIAIGIAVAVWVAQQQTQTHDSSTNRGPNDPMHDDLITLTSPAFPDNGIIPSQYTCDGENSNPPLQWSGTIPPLAKSFVLIMEDPDVPKSVRSDQMFDHWVVFNIPKTVKQIDEASAPPGVQGANTRGDAKYTGPCPPDKEHRYFFKLSMLDIMIDLPEGATKAQVLKAMSGHIIAQGQLIGRYNRAENN